MNIEEVAEKTPNEIYKLKISPGGDLLTHHARTIVYNLGLSGKTAKSAQKNILSIYKAFTSLDAALIEVNPLAVAEDAEVVILDCQRHLLTTMLFTDKDK